MNLTQAAIKLYVFKHVCPEGYIQENNTKLTVSFHSQQALHLGALVREILYTYIKCSQPY